MHNNVEGLAKKSNALMGSGVHVQPLSGASSVSQPLALVHTHQELPGAAYGFKSLFQSQERGDLIAAAGQDMLLLAGVAVSPSPASARGSTSRSTGGSLAPSKPPWAVPLSLLSSFPPRSPPHCWQLLGGNPRVGRPPLVRPRRGAHPTRAGCSSMPRIFRKRSSSPKQSQRR